MSSTPPISDYQHVKKFIKNHLTRPSDTEYLFISIYRINYSDRNRDQLMKDIIFHLSNPTNLHTDVKLIARFSTIYNNRILGLEVQNASIYGQKIEMALDDFDRDLASTIRKNDIIIIHRLNNKKLNMIDAMATLVGLGTHSPSGVKDGTVFFSEEIKSKFTDKTIKLANTMADNFLVNEKPFFSGMITLPQSVVGNSIKLTIEGQDMIRIMQHINTEEHEGSEIKGIPKDLDEFFRKLDLEKDAITIKGDDHISILHSTILKTLGSAVYEEITSYTDSNDASTNNIIILGGQLSQQGSQLTKFNDRIFIRGISNSMFMVHVSPIKALKLFVKYYAKNTGINTFFDFDLWDTSFFADKTIVENIYRLIYKDLTGMNPYFTFGLTLDYDDDEDGIIPYHIDKLTGRNTIFKLFKDHPLQSVFSQKTFDNIFKNRVNETVVMKYLNATKLKSSKGINLMAQFFINLVNPTDVDLTDKTGVLANGVELFLNNSNGDKTSYIISQEARRVYHKNLDKMRVDFYTTISLDYVVSTNFSSVRSTEYNPVLTNKMKSVPITQIIQLFIGAMSSIPISQSKQTTGFDNTSHNISQRIWLSSAIGFKHPITGHQSWIFKHGYKPVIFFGLNYKPAVLSTNLGDDLTYMSDSDTINSKMYTLPSVGSLAIYQWGIRNIHIGYSKFNEGDLDSALNIPQLSLGGTMSFDLKSIVGEIDTYVSENLDIQLGRHSNSVLKSIPRIGLFKLVETADQGSTEGASDMLTFYDDFGQLRDVDLKMDNFWVYLGYDLYAMNGGASGIKLKDGNGVILYSPIVKADGTAKIESLGANIFNSSVANVRTSWRDIIGDFPSDEKTKRGLGNDRVVVTGIKDYYDPTQFLPILKSFQHYIKFGLTGVNGEGDKNLYDDKKLFQIYHNMGTVGYYIKTYKLDDDNNRSLRINSLSEIVDAFIVFLEQFVGNDDKRRLMMIKYARNISVLKVSAMNGDGAPFRTTTVGNTRVKFFHPNSLMSAIEPHTLQNLPAMDTIRILLSFTRSISHYMNRVAKESTTGGVLYLPLSEKSDGNIFEIGDAISFQENPYPSSSISEGVDFLKKITITKNNVKTNLDIYKKIYYVWKITYYFGGAGTDPSGSSGNTLRVYITDSGIHWQSSYEEKDITTKIAETMQLNRLAVKI